MTSRQIKLGRFSENSKAAPLALSIKASEGLSERVRMESAGAGADAASGGSGQGGRSGCLPRFKMGGALEQAGALWGCDCVAGGGAEADCAGCDCGEDPLCAFREIGALKTRASSTPLRQLDLRPELTLRMIHRFRFCLFVPQTAYTPPPLPNLLSAQKPAGCGYPRGERRLRNWTPLTPIEKKYET